MAGSVGERIRRLRLRQGWSQLELVDGLPLSSSYVSLIESGRRHPRASALQLLAERLGCSVDYLRTGRGGDEQQQLERDLRFAELELASGDVVTARECFLRVAEQGTRIGTPEVVNLARWGLARAYEAGGDPGAAIPLLEQIVTDDEGPVPVSRPAVLTMLCRMYHQCGDLTRSVQVGEAALEEISRAGPPDDDADLEEQTELASTLVCCYYERGDLTRAHLLARAVVDRVERTGSARARALAYWNAALVAEARGDLPAAQDFAARALALYDESGNARAAALLRLVTAALLLRGPEPQHERAETLLRRTLEELPEVASQVEVAHAETELAKCRLLAGNASGAVTVARQALVRLEQGPPLESARARKVLGDVHLALGESAAAADFYTAAADDLEKCGDCRQAAAMWRELADAMTELGLEHEAMVAYRSAADVSGARGRVAVVTGAPRLRSRMEDRRPATR